MGIENGEIQAYISPLSILEVLIKPKREKNEVLENMYKIILKNYSNLSIANIDIVASVRAEYNIKTADSIIISTAITTSSQYLISNDIRLKSICDEKRISLVTMEVLKNNKGYFCST